MTVPLVVVMPVLPKMTKSDAFLKGTGGGLSFRYLRNAARVIIRQQHTPVVGKGWVLKVLEFWGRGADAQVM